MAGGQQTAIGGRTKRTAYFEHGIELDLRLRDAMSASHAGNCEADVRAALALPYVARQLAALDGAAVAAELDECGAWDAGELEDGAANHMRLVWIAACNVAEEASSRHPALMRAARSEGGEV